MQFPRLVYRSASDHLLVETEEQHAAALKDGWYASVPEALAGKPAVAEEAAPTVATKPAASPTPSKKATASPPAWQKE